MTVVGMERVGKLVTTETVTLCHREVNSANPADGAEGYARDMDNQVLDITDTSQDAFQERLHFTTYEQWIKTVPLHLYERPEFPAAVQDLLLDEIEESVWTQGLRD